MEIQVVDENFYLFELWLFGKNWEDLLDGNSDVELFNIDSELTFLDKTEVNEVIDLAHENFTVLLNHGAVRADLGYVYLDHVGLTDLDDRVEGCFEFMGDLVQDLCFVGVNFLEALAAEFFGNIRDQDKDSVFDSDIRGWFVCEKFQLLDYRYIIELVCSCSFLKKFAVVKSKLGEATVARGVFGGGDSVLGALRWKFVLFYFIFEDEFYQLF